jgi:hypothetical protein
VVDDVVVGSEDAIGEPVFAHELPDIFDRIEFGRFRRQRHQRDVFRDVELIGEMPTGLIEQQDGMGAWCHGSGDLIKMQRHGGDVAAGQDQTGRGSPRRTDGAEDIGRSCALIARRRWPRPAPCPTAGDLVLLADPSFVLEPDLYRLARRISPGDLVQAGGEVFLNAAMASGS